MTESPLRIAIIGDGLMGRSIEAEARELGWSVSRVLGRATMRDEPDAVTEALSDCDVALEFSTPESALENIRRCLTADCPVVVGTTGWHDDLPAVAAIVDERGGALLWAANFSVGVALLSQLVKRAGALVAELDDFDVRLLETHHAGKRDAPSGTALELARHTAEGLGRDVPITSVREGEVPGTHELILESAFETITLAHEARDRRVFARGALVAARWLRGRAGIYTMDDVFELGDG